MRDKLYLLTVLLKKESRGGNKDEGAQNLDELTLNIGKKETKKIVQRLSLQTTGMERIQQK